MNDGPLHAPGMGVEASTVPWPAGPHYFDLTGSDGSVAWIRYRVWAADWYTRTLQAVAGPEGNYDRLVGVEMALDGALNSLSAAFDAATGLVIEGAENALSKDEAARLPTWLYSWDAARGLLAEAGSLPCPGVPDPGVARVVSLVDQALEGARDEQPTGWLAALRRLRNQVAHQESLARHHESDRPSTVSAFGSSKGGAFDYLARSCDRVHDLTEQMVSLGISLGAHETHAGWERPRWFSR